jgi:glyoxylase-like metal-dependent hydrolase (beta-lactamase superfamily II)
MITELGDGVWWYDLRGVNAYLVDDGGTLTLVDTGNPWDGRTLILGIEAAGYSLQDIDRVLLTHFDFDHVGGLRGLHGLDATIYVGQDDAPFLTGHRNPPLGNHKGLLQRVLDPLVKAPNAPVETVCAGDEIGSFTAYHTPGHTPGHVVYVSEECSAAFLGDLVIERDGRLQASPWLMSYDTGRVEESVHELADRALNFEVAGMGHGTPFRQDGSEQLAELAATF